MNRQELLQIETWEQLQAKKSELKAEIDRTGKEITSQARQLIVKGAEVTAATVVSVLVTRAVATYLSYRKQREEESQRSPSISPDKTELRSDENTTTPVSRAATILMWMDTIVKLVETGIELYNRYSRENTDHSIEEE